MGLDITVYSKCEFVERLDNSDSYEDKYPWGSEEAKNTVFVYASYVSGKDDFSSRAPELKPNGVYRFAESLVFRAGSYSGYNQWREWLCKTVNAMAPRQIWNNRDTSKSLPFYELIDFSDCEGIIGKAQSEKLAKDFADYECVVNSDIESDDDKWFVEQYAKWRKAFELAAQDGFVYFH